VSDSAQRSVVTVKIAGEDYAIRTEASPEYSRECAALVDGMLREILDGGLLHSHKAPVLVALAIADRLFQARKEAASLRAELVSLTDGLADGIERELGSSSLATPS
jgi:cell division protein ZapA (FtsZ GTPase activity inhibitor)